MGGFRGGNAKSEQVIATSTKPKDSGPERGRFFHPIKKRRLPPAAGGNR